MASGSISGSTNNRYIVAQINWQSYSNTDGNYSDVNAQLFYRRTNSGYTTSGTIAGNLNIDGTDYGYGGHASIGSGWVQVASASKRVYHNNDGTRFIWICASGGISGTSFTSTSCGSGINLDTIPRASGMSLSTSTIAAGGSFTVNISPHSSGFSHKIEITGVGDTISYSVGAGTRSQTVTIPKARVTSFSTKSSTSATVKLTTLNGSSAIGSTSNTITVTVPSDVKPSLTAPTLTDSTKAYSVLNAFAANYSKVTVATTASVYKDDDFTDTATISSVTANYNGQNYDASSGSFTFVPSTVGTSDMTITVTDSRGKASTQTVSIPVAAYTRPTVTLSASRYADSAGTIADDTGAYAKVTAVCTLDTTDVADNSATVTLKYQEVGGTDWDTVDMGTITTSSTLSTVIPASDTKAYTLTATIADKIATTGATMALSNGAVPMDFLKGGKGIAIGKTAENGGLEIAWPIFGTGFVNSVNALITRAVETRIASLEAELNAIGKIYTVTINYTTNTWSQGTRDNTLYLPAGTYIVLSGVNFSDVKNGVYRQYQMQIDSGDCKIYPNLLGLYQGGDNNSADAYSTILHVVVATSSCAIRPYIHTPLAGWTIPIDIIAVRIR